MLACNPIPVVFWTQSLWLSRFMYLQWFYNKGNVTTPPSFEQIGQKEKYSKIISTLLTSIKKIKISTFILSDSMIKQTVDTILFYHKIKLITPEELKYLYDDLKSLMEYMENVCKLGYYPETGNEVRIFASYKPIPIDLNIIESSKLNIGIIYVMQLYPITTLNPQTNHLLKEWFKSILRASRLISQSNEAECKKYFSLQLQHLDELLPLIK